MVESLTRQLHDTSLDLFGEDDCVEGADSAFEEESSDFWMSPGLTRQNSYLESVPENCSLSRRSSLLEEDLKEPLSRRASKDSRSALSRRGSMLDELEPRDAREPQPLGRRDSLLEAVLAAKRGGWRGLVRTDSMESGASMASSMASVSSSSEGSVCPCDDCMLGLTDLLLVPAPHSQPSRPKKVNTCLLLWCPRSASSGRCRVGRPPAPPLADPRDSGRRHHLGSWESCHAILLSCPVVGPNLS